MIFFILFRIVSITYDLPSLVAYYAGGLRPPIGKSIATQHFSALQTSI